MLPRVLAERDLRLVNAMALASGTMKPAAARRYIARLEADAGLRSQRQDDARDPWGMGIPVIEEKADG